MDEALYRLHAECEETYWWWVAKNRIILSLVDRYAPRQSAGAGHVRQRALDIGCGAGAVLAALAKKYEAVGLDSSPRSLDYIRARGLHAMQATLPNHLPFEASNPGDRFHVIVMSEVVEHVAEDRASVAAAAALLAPGGILICTVPAHRWLWSSHDEFNHHQRRYTRRQFSSLFAGLPLTVLICSEYQCASMPLLLGARLLERLRTRLTGNAPAAPSVRPLPTLVNAPLRAAFEVEKYLLPHVRMPWGSSIITVHRRA